MSKDLMDVKPMGDPPAEVVEDNSEMPSKEEQALYDKFVTRAIGFINGEQTEKQVLAMMNQPDAPVHENVGRTAAKVVQLIQQSAESSGQQVPPHVLEAAGEEILSHLMENGIEAGIFPIEKDSKEHEQALELALLEGMKAYGEDILAGPDGEKASAEAKDTYAREVAREADSGELDPAFAEAIQQQQMNPEYAQMNAVSDGVQKAVSDG